MNDKTVDALISQADELLAETSPEEALPKLEAYAADFDAWFERYQKSVDSGSPLADKSALEELLTRHEKVVDLTSRMQDTFPEEMKKLKQKGKGILAYTDTLPKKISFTKTRKG